MKKFLRLFLLILGVLLLLLAAAAMVVMTSLRPLTVEAGEDVPAAEEFCRYPFFTSVLEGDPAAQVDATAAPGQYPVTLRVLGIPCRTVLTVQDTTPPQLTPVPRGCFLGEKVAISELVEVRDVTEVELSYVTEPDLDRAGEQTVTVAATDLGGNRTTVEVPLAVYAISNTVSVEAGTPIEAVKMQITDAIAGEIVFDDALKALDTAHLGEHRVNFLLDGREIGMTLAVVDTVPPEGQTQTGYVLLGGTADPKAFLQQIDDATAVEVTFAETPDFSRAGMTSVGLVLTDAAGNTAELNAVARVYAAPAFCTLEMGTFKPEELRDMLLAGEELSLDEALITDPKPGEVLIPLTTEKGDSLTQTLTFTDSYPPVGEAQNRTVYAGQTLEPKAFVAYAADSTAVTYAFTDGNAPDFSQVGAYPVSVTLTDMGGNSTELTAQLTVLPDTEAPVLYGAVNKVIYIGESISYLRGVSAWDSCDGAVQVQVDSSKVRPRQAGTYEVTYTAADRAGNTATRTVTFTVRAADLEALNELADGILQGILREGMTEVQRARAIYDWVVSHMSYTAYADKTDYVAAAFYGFRNKRGDCFVYYAMSRVLLTRAGFENLEIKRNNPAQPHFWNLVKTGGSWYHFDTCPHYAAHPLTCFLLTDAEVKAYSENHVANYYSFDASLYPATP